jgi:hypothetical protein
MLSEKVLTVMEVHFPGGLSKFEETGGSVFIVPDNEIIIFHPGFDSKAKLKILSGLKSTGYKVSFVKEGNFEGAELEEVKDFQGYLIAKLMSLGIEQSSVLVSKATVYLSVPTHKSTQVAIKRLKDFLSSIKGVVRGHIECQDKIIRFGNPQNARIKRRETSRIQPEHNRPDRDTRINEDDILNLRIALESSKSFEEFLNNI